MRLRGAKIDWIAAWVNNLDMVLGGKRAEMSEHGPPFTWVKAKF